MPISLRSLTNKDERAFLKGYELAGADAPNWYTFSWKPGMPYSELLEILEKESAGIDLAPDRVAHTMLYGFLNGAIIGRVSVRHELTERLSRRGGHIGYWVAKDHRGQRYATEMVKQALPFCRSLGIQSLLVTCAENNEASCKIIENFGGKLENKIYDEEDHEMICRYWIKLV